MNETQSKTRVEKVRLNVGGTLFITNRDTLTRHPGTLLTELDTSSSYYDNTSGEYHFDRDPAVFACILNFYRTKQLHVTQALCGNAVRNELDFWKISESVISPCCWRTLHQVDQDKDIMAALSKDSSIEYEEIADTCWMSVRNRVWTIMEKPGSSLAAKVWNGVLFVMIILQSITYCLDTEPELRRFPQNGTDEYRNFQYFLEHDPNIRRTVHLFTNSNIPLYVLDLACLFFFSLELLVHLFVCPHPARFFRLNLLHWVDLLSVLIGWTLFTLEQISDVFEDGWTAFNAFLVIKSVYVIRLFRVFRLMQSNSNLRIIFLALMECKKELLLLVFSVSILAVIFGSFVYFCEDTNAKFESIPVSIWWAVITMTTVGYGDMYPTTACGYAIGSVCAFLGVLALTLPVAVIATHFSDYYCVNLWRTKAARLKVKQLD